MKKDPRKEELKRAQQKLAASIPMKDLKDLRDLFDHLDRSAGCDNTLRKTIKFLKKRRLDVESVVAWLEQWGGFCDCEVVSNVDRRFGEIVGR